MISFLKLFRAAAKVTLTTLKQMQNKTEVTSCLKHTGHTLTSWQLNIVFFILFPLLLFFKINIHLRTLNK